MALMLSRTYDALIDAGASPDKAREAAEEIASLDGRLSRLDRRLAILDIKVTILMVGMAFVVASVLKILIDA